MHTGGQGAAQKRLLKHRLQQEKAAKNTFLKTLRVRVQSMVRIHVRKLGEEINKKHRIITIGSVYIGKNNRESGRPTTIQKRPARSESTLVVTNGTSL